MAGSTSAGAGFSTAIWNSSHSVNSTCNYVSYFEISSISGFNPWWVNHEKMFYILQFLMEL